MKHKFQDHFFRQSALEIIEQANEIVEKYSEQGYDLTLRQLYYQFVSRNWLRNEERQYKRLGSIINDARLAGLIDWESIVDRTRIQRQNSHWEKPADILFAAAESYAIDTRVTQKYYLEVWVEKDALIGIVEAVCRPLDVGFMSCRGYVSLSAMHEAAGRFHKEPGSRVLLYLGDHDPSGIDMTRDIQDRLDIFAANVEVERIALSMDQIEEYSPPPNPAKVTDSRYDNYVLNYGDESWELDALEPQVLTAIIEAAIKRYTNEVARKKLVRRQETERKQLYKIAEKG